MMTYVALARKYRPTHFSDVVGQTFVVRCLSNAIEQHRVHHAYILEGGRGVGKTSLARLFSKALRCVHAAKKNDFIEPCGNCDSCQRIQKGQDVDVLELDGASYNGVDTIRELRENARFLPAQGSKKIFIIDEVHMLSVAAFNALLKVLEEPPAHIIFILATTEIGKIPATILSRCQKFTLPMVSYAVIKAHLEQIAHQEAFSYDPLVLEWIAKQAAGSVRDALSLLDQMLHYNAQHIGIDIVEQCSAGVSFDTTILLLKALFEKDLEKGLHILQNASIAQGGGLKCLQKLLEALHVLVLLIARVPAVWIEQQGLLLTSEVQLLDQFLGEHTQALELKDVQMRFDILHEGCEWLVRSPCPQAVLHLLWIKSIYADHVMAQKHVHKIALSKPLVRSAPALVPPPPLLSSSSSSSSSSSLEDVKVLDLSSEVIWAKWPQFLKMLKKEEQAFLAGLLENICKIHLKKEKNCILYFATDSYYSQTLKKEEHQKVLHAYAKKFFLSELFFEIDFYDGEETFAQKNERIVQHEKEQQEKTFREHKVIIEAEALFNGKLGPIREYGEGSL